MTKENTKEVKKENIREIVYSLIAVFIIGVVMTIWEMPSSYFSASYILPGLILAGLIAVVLVVIGLFAYWFS